MVIPVSASPSLDDAYISYSVKGYYSQYLFSTTWSSNSTISPEGLISSTPYFSLLSDYFSVYPGGTVGLFDDNSLKSLPISVCFYDSNYNVVSGGFSSSKSYFNVPSGVSFCRFSQKYSNYLKIISSATPFDSSNYTYLFNSIDDISIQNGLISIPYQSYSYTGVFIDLEFYSSSYYLTNFGFDVYTYFSSSLPHLNNVPNVYLDENVIELYTYHFDHGDKQFAFCDDSISNPTYFDESFNNRQPFSGFRLYIPVSFNDALGSVSTSLQIEFSNFYIDSKEAVYAGDLEKLVDDKQEQVSAVISDLTLPTPNIHDAFSGLDDLSTAYHNSETELVATFHILYDSFPIIVLFMTLSISMTVLGYILFGKSG